MNPVARNPRQETLPSLSEDPTELQLLGAEAAAYFERHVAD